MPNAGPNTVPNTGPNAGPNAVPHAVPPAGPNVGMQGPMQCPMQRLKEVVLAFDPAVALCLGGVHVTRLLELLGQATLRRHRRDEVGPRLLPRHLQRVALLLLVRQELREPRAGRQLLLGRPVLDPMIHRRRQGRPRQPRARRGKHAHLTNLLLPLFVPRRPAAQDALVAHAPGRLHGNLLPPLGRRLLLERARQRRPLPFERHLLCHHRLGQCLVALALQLLDLLPQLLVGIALSGQLLPRLPGRAIPQSLIPIFPPRGEARHEHRPAQPRGRPGKHAPLPRLLFVLIVPSSPSLDQARVGHPLDGTLRHR